ncbi:MAG TPA: tRNA(Ile)(2)-agmatinylcytidine synthase [Methanocorpusculum sp.]|nr:tRNA(Ile)(2)-agmatinylcytidine synthase [Methanocorpusculum sp.]
MLLGIDDTDSPDGMCTTYLGTILAHTLKKSGYKIGELKLIRLNPNVIWKTRGNAAICLEIFDDDIDSIFDCACSIVEKYAEFDCDNTNPGIVAVKTAPSSEYYYQTLQNFVTIDQTITRLQKIGAKYKGYKCKRGLIGALAAVSSVLPDSTYEYLAYRYLDKVNTTRQIDKLSFIDSAKKTYPHTWDTIDFETEDIVCVPHGNDPVLYGIRGETEEWVRYSASLLKSEPIEYTQIWRTNQGCDAHLIPYVNGIPVDGLSYIIEGIVTSKPITYRGGHVKFSITPQNSSDLKLNIFAFEPTKRFRDDVRKLIPNDQITVCGSWQNGGLHLEKFRLNVVANDELRKSPRCPYCNGRMTSAGLNKGYKCRDCSTRIRTPIFKSRSIVEGWYEVPPDSRRHLAKPLARFKL